jgi:uncharacterized protein
MGVSALHSGLGQGGVAVKVAIVGCTTCVFSRHLKAKSTALHHAGPGAARTEVAGASIADGTALDNAVGYGCWRVAYLLVERGAHVTKLWQAAGLGMMPRVEEMLAVVAPPTAEDINNAFWQACSGGHRRVAEYLFTRGADVNAVPDWAERTPLDAAGGGPEGPGLDTGRQALVTWLREKGARSAGG